MKKIVFSLILMFIATVGFNQNEDYKISFSATGDTASVGTIEVVNLTTFDTVWLNGTDTLHLIGWMVGQNENEEIINKEDNILVFPNPMSSSSTLNITTTNDGNSVISIFNIEGKRLFSVDVPMKSGTNQFKISGLPTGNYVINVFGRYIKCSTKLISIGFENSPHISYIGHIPNNNNSGSGNLKNTTNIVQMTYHDGERLQYRGQTSTFKNLAVDVPLSSKTQNFHFLSCFDNSGHHYETVEIQVPFKKKLKSTLDSTYTQTWMAENLNVGEFRVASPTGFHNDTIIEKFCYDNDTNNCTIYGGLYNWNELMMYQTDDSIQGICPEGWRIPSQEDWENLVNYYGGAPFNLGFFSGDSIAGGKMKEVGTVHWADPNNDATNESGFTAMGGGSYSNSSSGWAFYGNTDGCYWTSTQVDATTAKVWWMQSCDGIIFNAAEMKYQSFSVRCVHD